MRLAWFVGASEELGRGRGRFILSDGGIKLFARGRTHILGRGLSTVEGAAFNPRSPQLCFTLVVLMF